MTKSKKEKLDFNKQHRALSPLLATVILLGITVVGGGLVFAVFSANANTASTANVIAIENAQAVKGTDHADVTATIKNAGGTPWTKLEMTVGKSELSEPLLYESLHENIAGCTDTSSNSCGDTTDNSSPGPSQGRDNPLRAQWLISLDKTAAGESNRADDRADHGEGASVGRKLVFDSKNDYREIQILNGTAVAKLFGQSDADSPNLPSVNPDMPTCTPNGDDSCTAVFEALDSDNYGSIYCDTATTAQLEAGIFAVCDVYTHTFLDGQTIGPGESKFFYADAFIEEIPGLNNLIVEVGDALVLNLSVETADGNTARAQTVVKVQGI